MDSIFSTALSLLKDPADRKYTRAAKSVSSKKEMRQIYRISTKY